MDLHRRRHNVSDACFTCRKSKVKCDDVLPCSRCIKNNRADSCVSWRRFKSSCLVYLCRFVIRCLSLFLILIAFPPVSVSTRVSASSSIAHFLSRSLLQFNTVALKCNYPRSRGCRTLPIKQLLFFHHAFASQCQETVADRGN